ncbi:MAG: protein phosphatase 2C domain-containing protein [Actinomycetales bacterium]
MGSAGKISVVDSLKFTVGDAGRAYAEVQPRAPLEESIRPDVALAQFEYGRVTARAVTLRGLIHQAAGGPRQDAYCVRGLADGSVLAAVADGVGSLPRSHEAADTAVLQVVKARTAGAAWQEAFEQANTVVRDMINDKQDLATTLVATHIRTCETGVYVSVGWVGDSEMWHLSPDTAWTCLTAPNSARPDSDIYSTTTSSIPATSLTVQEIETCVDAGALFLVTDGVGGPLRIHGVQQALGDAWRQAPDIFTFGAQANFGRKSHMDDRTVVGFWL